MKPPTMFLLWLSLLFPLNQISAEPESVQPHLFYIDTQFENASPLYWEIEKNGKINVYLVYDHERNSPNRANGHYFFRIEAEPGSRLTLVLNNLKNIWNGQPGNPLSDQSICRISQDGNIWDLVKLQKVDEYRYQFEIEMKGNSLYIAHIEPYRLSDLNAFLDEIRSHPRVKIQEIGRTVQGRPLEIIRVGDKDAPHHILIRARAHPWEAGGNWVVEGLIRSLLYDDPANQQYLKQYSVCVLPLANKDGVALGRTRFNVRGMDLNRNWGQPADPSLALENVALERWLEQEIQAGRKPDLAFDLHNDQSGRLHLSWPPIDHEHYLKQMERYEVLMRQYTWYTEGSTGSNFRNSGTFGEGLLERYGITAFVQELNCNWVEGLHDYASRKNWELLGSQYRELFYQYFKDAETMREKD